MTIIWCMVPEIWSMADRIFCHLDCFFPFYPPKNSKNQHFEKIKRTSGDTIMLHICTINGIHMMYGCWDIKCDKQNFLSFWTIFCPFNTLTTWKIKISKKWKKHLEISFYTSVPKIMVICYTVPEIWCMTNVIVIFHFGLFFALLPPQSKKSKFL